MLRIWNDDYHDRYLLRAGHIIFSSVCVCVEYSCTLEGSHIYDMHTVAVFILMAGIKIIFKSFAMEKFAQDCNNIGFNYG